MKKLVLNKETLARISPDRVAAVRGAMPVSGWTEDACGTSALHLCVTDSPCNSVDTCAPRCPNPPVCTGTMSGGPTKPQL